MAVIRATDIWKEFPSQRALEGVSLEVEAGSFFGLFGPNGAGKSTLLRILTGQIEPSRGEATVLDLDVRQDPMAVKERIGIVPEVESPPSYLTAYEYLYFVGKVRHVPQAEGSARHWLRFFDMEDAEGKICKDLSKGTRQKLMIASAFLHEPKLVFLDEPFINLDPLYQKRLRDYLQGYIRSGGTVFMASHLLEIAERLCDHIAIIDRGRIRLQGRMEVLRKDGESLEALFHRVVGEPS